MKHISLILLLTMLLTSCGNVTATPQATVPSQPTATATVTPSPTLTPTLTPTATPDPLAGAPEGATDVKTVNGEKIYLKVDKATGRVSQWMDKELTLVGGQKLTLEPQWFDIATKGTKNGKFGDPTYLLSGIKNTVWLDPKNEYLPMTVLTAESLHFLGSIYMNDLTDMDYDFKKMAFPGLLISDLYESYRKSHPEIQNIPGPNNPVAMAFKDDFDNNGSNLVIDGFSEPFMIDRTHEYNVVIMDSTTIIDGKPISKSKLFQRFNAAVGVSAYWALAMDANGNLIYLVAPIKKLESLDDKQFRVMLLIPIMTLSNSSDSSKIFGMAYSGLSGLYADSAGSSFFGPEYKNKLPYLAIERAP